MLQAAGAPWRGALRSPSRGMAEPLPLPADVDFWAFYGHPCVGGGVPFQSGVGVILLG